MKPAIAAVTLATLLAAGAAGAHAFDPWRLDVTAAGGGAYEVALKIARGDDGSDQARAGLQIVFPARCRTVREPVESTLRGAVLRTWSIACGASLGGSEISVESVDELPFEVILRMRDGEAPLFTALLDRRTPRVTLPTAARPPSRPRLALRYLGLGVTHILTGADHLLFVTCLMLLARGRRLVASITAFTLGHCVTLALASLGVLRVASAPVEVCIAASVAILAGERLRADDSSRRAGAPVAAVFGLLHGLGFAGALAEVGLPRGDVALSLACFNGGVEIGQLAFVVVALVAASVLRRIVRAPDAPLWIARGAGLVASWWAGERLAACL